MPRALSIHIGVNDPQERGTSRPLKHSEASAWRMAALAEQAGYDALQLLRGREATRQAVDDALAGAARTLVKGDTLFVSFSGHGTQLRDLDGDDYGWDETWCLYDGVLLDDKLAGFWRLFESGVRIVVVSESCFGAGMLRNDEYAAYARARAPGRRRRTKRSAPAAGGGAEAGEGRVSCIGEPPNDAYGIRAGVLLLSAATEDEPGRDGMYMEALLEVWDGGAFRGSYCELHAQLCARLMSVQKPQILMGGAPDPGFPLETAFHRTPARARRSRSRRP
jgi:hypothetical protein